METEVLSYIRIAPCPECGNEYESIGFELGTGEYYYCCNKECLVEKYRIKVED